MKDIPKPWDINPKPGFSWGEPQHYCTLLITCPMNIDTYNLYIYSTAGQYHYELSGHSIWLVMWILNSGIIMYHKHWLAMSIFCQYVNIMSICQYYANMSILLCQYYVNIMSILCQYSISIFTSSFGDVQPGRFDDCDMAPEVWAAAGLLHSELEAMAHLVRGFTYENMVIFRNYCV